MTQFITVTASSTKQPIRLNVAAILQYSRGASDPSTEILLWNGGTLLVTEGVLDLDELIRNAPRTGVASSS